MSIVYCFWMDPTGQHVQIINVSDCLLCLAYVGDYGFKEICAETTAVIDKEATQEENESSEYSSDDDDDEDLVGTGILNGNDTEDNADPEEKSDPKEKSDLKDNSDSNDVDKKPLIMFMPQWMYITLKMTPL